jgi:putative nucleotidyltransferase-like protein
VRATSSSPAESIRDSLRDEAHRLLAASRARGVPLRLLGGMGIQLLLGERLDPRFQREVGDLDFFTPRRSGAAAEALLAAHGWEPQRRFNTLNGARRLLFDEPAGSRHVDVFVGDFQMCHALPLAERLEVCQETLPAAELALTKLQIVALNAKDRGDLYALLLGCEVSDHDAGAINAQRIAALAGADWGLHHTIELNLARLREGLAAVALPSAQRELIEQRIARLSDALERSPKSRGWRLRARVGERRRWYEEPEEVER